MNRKLGSFSGLIFKFLGFAFLALVCVAAGSPAVRDSLSSLRLRTNKDAVRGGPMLIEVFKQRAEEGDLLAASRTEYHNYFHQGPDFHYFVRGFGGSGLPRRTIRAMYLQCITRQMDHSTWEDHRFEWLDIGRVFTVTVSSVFSRSLNLVPGTIYDLTTEIPGWPTAHGLIINHEGELVFEGLTDSRPHDAVSTDNLSTIRVTQTRVLNDHYMKSDDPCYGKIKNMEVAFAATGRGLILQRGESSKVILQQGQSARLGQYEINLLVARSVEYKGRCYDAGISGMSFTIARLEKEQGAKRPQPLGDLFTIYLKPGVIDFPRTLYGYPSHLVVPSDSVRFPRASSLGEILRELGWAACEKTVPGLREGDTMPITPNYSRRETATPRTVGYSEPMSRAYIIYLTPDLLRPTGWRREARKHLLESGYVDSVQFGPLTAALD